MTSGFGIVGRGKCYPTWSSFEKCMAESDDSAAECAKLRQDYFDCLHLQPLGEGRTQSRLGSSFTGKSPSLDPSEFKSYGAVMFFKPRYHLEHRREVNPDALIQKMIGFSHKADRTNEPVPVNIGKEPRPGPTFKPKIEEQTAE